MNTARFEFALDRLKSTDWAEFEHLASVFLSVDYPDLRTMASPSGDGGRDAELFCSKGDPSVALQYSITTDWKGKIKDTIDRLRSRHPKIRILIYATSQVIGARADDFIKDLKQDIKRKKVYVDIRDRNWFVERCNSTVERQEAAKELIRKIAEPYLDSDRLIETDRWILSNQEAHAAVLYLGLQLKDDTQDKGLTSLSFDALVRAALRHTNSENRLSHTQLHEAICKFLPSHQPEQLIPKIEAALKRLTKRYIRHWTQSDEF